MPTRLGFSPFRPLLLAFKPERFQLRGPIQIPTKLGAPRFGAAIKAEAVSQDGKDEHRDDKSDEHHGFLLSRFSIVRAGRHELDRLAS